MQASHRACPRRFLVNSTPKKLSDIRHIIFTAQKLEAPVPTLTILSVCLYSCRQVGCNVFTSQHLRHRHGYDAFGEFLRDNIPTSSASNHRHSDNFYGSSSHTIFVNVIRRRSLVISLLHCFLILVLKRSYTKYNYIIQIFSSYPIDRPFNHCVVHSMCIHDYFYSPLTSSIHSHDKFYY